ncbi:MAG: hypothetical protein H7X95_01660 [Deltaproteobacteria bacterium]|nr:hypothetical protein [Deltaproteobacteria bacterium]
MSSKMTSKVTSEMNRNPSPRRWRLSSWSKAAVAGSLALGFVGMIPGTSRMATGSIMIALDLPTMVKQADHIAVVEVTTVKAAWDERHERIYSTIELKVVENWKNASAPAPATASSTAASPVAAPDHLTVVQAGGTVGDMSMTVTGSGTFVPGERSLVFLRGPANRARVVGMAQGKRAMRYETASRTWVVAPPDLRQTKLVRPPVGRTIDLKAVAKPSPQQSRPETASAVSATRDLPLDDVRTEINRLLGTARP